MANLSLRRIVSMAMMILLLTSPTMAVHYIAAGRPGLSLWNDFPTSECTYDDSTQASVATDLNNACGGYAGGDMDIAVSCCLLDGSSGKRDGCLYAASYDEAKSHCEDNGYRLCTMDEMLDGLTAGTGCGFDCRYSWVSDRCMSGWEATSTETFDGVDMEIGWIQYSHCEEGENANIYNPDYTMDELIEMAETAITVKIMPSGEIPGQNETASYTVMADLCSNPIYALNRGYTMSWQVDETTDPPVVTGLADTSNWIGATNLMWSTCYGDDSYGAEPSTLGHGYVYHACGHVGGLHIRHDETDLCWFDWKTYTGYDVSVWLGFDKYSSDRYCDFDDAGNYTLMFHVGDNDNDNASNTTSSSSSSLPSALARDWKWIEKEVEGHIPKEIPTVTLLAFGVFCILCCAFFQCCCRRKTKAYKRLEFEDEMPSDTDTDCDAAQPMNL